MAHNQEFSSVGYTADWSRAQPLISADPKQSPAIYPGIPPYPNMASMMGQGFGAQAPMMAPMPGYAPMPMAMPYMGQDQFNMSQNPGFVQQQQQQPDHGYGRADQDRRGMGPNNGKGQMKGGYQQQQQMNQGYQQHPQQQQQQPRPPMNNNNNNNNGNGNGNGGGKSKGKGKGNRRRRANEENGNPALDIPPRAHPTLVQHRIGRPVDFLDVVDDCLVDFCKDQFGSRYIQQQLEIAEDADAQKLFDGCMKILDELTRDVFGNYVIQKFFDYGSAEQRLELCNRFKGEVKDMSLQLYGCRVIQKALETASCDVQCQLVGEIKENVIECVEDQNGNHVIQKCIEQMPPDTIKFIVDIVEKEIYRMSQHCYGCRVVQRLIEHCQPDQISGIIDGVLLKDYEMACDQYGNYVIQHILEHSVRSTDRDAVVDLVCGRMQAMSCHKFASNIVEKCLVTCESDDRAKIIGAALGETQAEQTTAGNQPMAGIFTMMTDRFGNYVLQRMMDIVEGTQRDVFIDILNQQRGILGRYTYGKHIQLCLEKMIKERADEQRRNNPSDTASGGGGGGEWTGTVPNPDAWGQWNTATN